MENTDKGKSTDGNAQQLKKVYAMELPAAGIEEKTLSILRQHGHFTLSSSQKKHFLAVAFSAAVIAFIAGLLTGNSAPGKHNIPANRNEYLLLLYEPADFVRNASHNKEYGEWARQLEQKKVVAEGRELSPQSWGITNGQSNTVTVASINGDKNQPTGFFLLNTL